MRKILSILIFVAASILFAACNKSDSNVIVSGTIKGLENSKNDINRLNLNFIYKSESIPIQNDGSFSKQIAINEPTYVSFYAGRAINGTILLRPSEDLVITIDLNKPKNDNIHFEGSLAKFCNALKVIDKGINDVSLYDNLAEDEFIERAEELKNNMFQMLDTLITDPEFLQQQRISVKSSVRTRYLHYRKQNLWMDKSREFSEEFLAHFKLWDYDDNDAFKYSMNFRRHVLQDIKDTIYFKHYKNNGGCHGKAGMSVLGNAKNGYVKDCAIMYCHERMLRSDIRDEVYNFLISNATSQEAKQFIDKIYQGMTAGAKVIPFKLESYSGEMVSLEDFKGKYIYIDIWATWCAPCIAQMPYLDTIEQKYHDRNIEFISISVDNKEKDYKKWRDKVKELNLNGTQLIADREGSSDFLKQINNSTIPHFVLIDPYGKLVDGYAPRPSNPKLIELLESLDL